jgi:hypothetical protein
VLRLTPLFGWLALCGTWIVPASGTAGEVQRLRYAGQLIQRDAQGTGVPVRSFILHAWVVRAEEGRTALCRVDDEGRNGLAWYERSSRQQLAAGGEWSGSQPRLRHLHDGRSHLLTLPGPLVAHPLPLAADAEWEAEWDGRRIDFSVAAEERLAGRECWKIEGASNTGRRQTLHLDKETDLLVSASLRVFIGQGERFDLLLRLEDQQSLTGAELAAELAVAERLMTLHAELAGRDAVVTGPLMPRQLALVEAALPDLKTMAQGTSWERLVQSLEGDVVTERQRAESLEKLAARFVGKAAPEFTLIGADGRPIDRAADAGQVVILHFWEYRGTPEAPFGQVGYLDFLAGKRKGDGVRVYGIAVEERLADPGQAPAIRREVRQFGSQFIRVGYPLAVDDGSLLATFGDPRPLGAPLPLWVVIGRDGTVVHHKAGVYNIDPNRGLEELDAVTAKALGK